MKHRERAIWAGFLVGLAVLVAFPALAGSGLDDFGAAQGGSGGGGSGTDLTGLGTDNRLARWNGTNTVQSSGITVDDTDNVAMPAAGAIYWPSGTSWNEDYLSMESFGLDDVNAPIAVDKTAASDSSLSFQSYWYTAANSGTGAAGLGTIHADAATNNAGTPVKVVQREASLVSAAFGAETSRALWKVLKGGAQTEQLRVDGSTGTVAVVGSTALVGQDGTQAMEGFRRRTYDCSGPTTLTASQSGSIITNTSATGAVAVTLPTLTATAQIGVTYTFLVDAAQQITITAGASDTIQVAAATSSAAGTAYSSTSGDVLTIVAISTSEWVAVYGVGTWTTN